MYVCVSSFHVRTAWSIEPKLTTELRADLGQALGYSPEFFGTLEFVEELRMRSDL